MDERTNADSIRARNEPRDLVTRLFARQPLYDDSIRRRTLDAVEARATARERRLAWIIAPAGALVLFVSFALPAWLLSIPLSTLLGSHVLALAVGLFVVHTLGVIPAGLCTVLAFRHGSPGGRPQEVLHE